MDEQTRADRLAEMAQRRLEGLRSKAADDIALRMLRNGETPTPEAVADALAAEWQEPNDRELADMVAAKCAAAVDHARQRAEAACGRVAAAEAKVARFRDLLAAAEADLDEATAEADAGLPAQQLAEWEELAANAGATAAPTAAPTTTASAGVADGKGN